MVLQSAINLQPSFLAPGLKRLVLNGYCQDRLIPARKSNLPELLRWPWVSRFAFLIQRSTCVSSLKDLTDSDPESSTAERLGAGASSGFKWKSSVGEALPPKPCLPCSSSPLTSHFGSTLIRHQGDTRTLLPLQVLCSFLFLTTGT